MGKPKRQKFTGTAFLVKEREPVIVQASGYQSTERSGLFKADFIYQMPAMRLILRRKGITMLNLSGLTSETDETQRFLLEDQTLPEDKAELTRRNVTFKNPEYTASRVRDAVNSIAYLRQFYFKGDPPDPVDIHSMLKFLNFVSSIPAYLMNRREGKVKPNGELSRAAAGIFKAVEGYNTLGIRQLNEQVESIRVSDMYPLARGTLRFPDAKDENLRGRSFLFRGEGERRKTCPAPGNDIGIMAEALFGNYGNPEHTSLLDYNIDLTKLKEFAAAGSVYRMAAKDYFDLHSNENLGITDALQIYALNLNLIQPRIHRSLGFDTALSPAITFEGLARYLGYFK